MTGAVGGVIKSYSKYGAVSFISSYEDFIYIYVIVWEVRIGKNCDRGLENAARVFYKWVCLRNFVIAESAYAPSSVQTIRKNFNEQTSE